MDLKLMKSASAICDFDPISLGSGYRMVVMWLCFHQASHGSPIRQCANARFPVLTQTFAALGHNSAKWANAGSGGS